MENMIYKSYNLEEVIDVYYNMETSIYNNCAWWWSNMW